ncbi:hypothetical protein [Jeongeupia sp. USM3]|uniref:primase 1D-like protein n=1 Tax=Jeongeupia sp. USM3 TaxID=1906741 RepID=UPI0011AB62FA|nr:hypothetical protein [Jeongeupia sp. USM3]
MNSVPADHPYWMVRELVVQRLDVCVLSFSFYTYIPNSVSDFRRTISLSRDDLLNEGLVAKLMASTGPDEDFAIHSSVTLSDGSCVHMPMVDMDTKSPAQLDKIRSYIGDYLFHKLVWYRSGRSFHGYGCCLIDEKEWVGFMGDCCCVIRKA